MYPYWHTLFDNFFHTSASANLSEVSAYKYALVVNPIMVGNFVFLFNALGGSYFRLHDSSDSKTY